MEIKCKEKEFEARDYDGLCGDCFWDKQNEIFTPDPNPKCFLCGDDSSWWIRRDFESGNLICFDCSDKESHKAI